MPFVFWPVLKMLGSGNYSKCRGATQHFEYLPENQRYTFFWTVVWCRYTYFTGTYHFAGLKQS